MSSQVKYCQVYLQFTCYQKFNADHECPSLQKEAQKQKSLENQFGEEVD